MTVPSQITTHATDGIAKLLDELRGEDREVWEAFVSIWLDRVQELENAVWEVLSERLLDSAVGAQLDFIGDLVGQPRNSDGDSVYRLWVKARIKVNLSHGETDVLLDLLATFLGHEEFRIVFGSRDILIDILREITTEPINAIADILFQAKAAGLSLKVVYSVRTPETTFSFGYDDETSATQGYSNDDDTGGYYASVRHPPNA